MATGRPTEYTPEKGDLICQLTGEGHRISKIAKDADITRDTIVRWQRDNSLLLPDGEKFSDAYARALEIGWELMAHEMLEVADDGTNDFYTTEDGQEKCNHEHIQRSRLRVDTMKWILSKRVARVFGDKLDVTGIPANQTNIVLPIRDKLARIKRAKQDGAT
jgi:hypothetical protein